MSVEISPSKPAQLETGTTTVGIVVNGGVVIATESQATAGYTVATKRAQKLFRVNNHTAATISGGVADCQYVVRQVQAISRLEAIRKKGDVPPTKYIAEIVKNILFNGRSFFISMMIIGGYDTKLDKPKLFGVDLLGALYEEDSFISFGSGSPFALGVLQAEWKANMSKDEGVALVTKAITASRARDAASGYEFQVCFIDKSGFQAIQGIHGDGS